MKGEEKRWSDPKDVWVLCESSVVFWTSNLAFDCMLDNLRTFCLDIFVQQASRGSYAAALWKDMKVELEEESG